jgi:hypothetical protein
MILVITIKEVNEKSGNLELIVSHGVNLVTDEIVILQQVHPSLIGAIFDYKLGEYVLNN